VTLLTWNGKVIDVETPNNVVLKVVDTAGSDKGNTKDGGSKAATLETGAVIQVPMFINVGEEIMVDTRNDLYLSRQGGASF
jgi:elongation factor P